MQLVKLFGYLSYISKSGTEKEKKAIIIYWLNIPTQPAIAAISALGPGFDYLSIYWVIYINVPSLISDFSQESGRADRNGIKACSIIIISQI
jgi:ATP-dependent DNA helicase RecQ